MKSRCPYRIILIFFLTITGSQAQYDPDRHPAETDAFSVARSSGSYNCFLKGLHSTGLEELLSEGGQFTVFLPSDEAVAKSSGEPIRMIKKAQLTSHIIAGRFSAADLLRKLSRGKGKARLTTLRGHKIHLEMQGLDILLIDPKGNTARITRADQGKDDLAVHHIDGLLLTR